MSSPNFEKFCKDMDVLIKPKNAHERKISALVAIMLILLLVVLALALRYIREPQRDNLESRTSILLPVPENEYRDSDPSDPLTASAFADIYNYEDAGDGGEITPTAPEQCSDSCVETGESDNGLLRAPLENTGNRQRSVYYAPEEDSKLSELGHFFVYTDEGFRLLCLIDFTFLFVLALIVVAGICKRIRQNNKDSVVKIVQSSEDYYYNFLCSMERFMGDVEENLKSKKELEREKDKQEDSDNGPISDLFEL